MRSLRSSALSAGGIVCLGELGTKLYRLRTRGKLLNRQASKTLSLKHTNYTMASEESVNLNEAHPPSENAVKAFTIVLPTIKKEIIKSRRNWDKHEPRMWSRAARISDEDLTTFDIGEDLVEIRSASTSYGHIIFGKIRIPATKDKEGEGFIHVRIHDPPNRGTEDVKFHSLFTDEGGRDSDGRPTTWRAIQTVDTPLEFFNE